MDILKSIWGRLPSGLVFFCTFLAWFIPFSVHWINTRLHEWGDPAWKRESSGKPRDLQQELQLSSKGNQTADAKDRNKEPGNIAAGLQRTRN